MADQAPPGVNMPKKRDPRLRQMQAPQQQQFFDSADYEVRKQQQQQQVHGQQPPSSAQRQKVAEGNVRAGYGGVPQAAQPSGQYPQRQHQSPQAPPPPSAPQSNMRAPPNRQSPAY